MAASALAVRSRTIIPRRLGRLLNPVLVLLVLYLAVLPILALIYSSFKASGSALPTQVAGFSLQNFELVFESSASGTVAINTAVYVAGSLLLGLTLSLVLTYLLERTNMPAREFLSAAILSPMAIPALVMAIAWSFLANPANGPLSLAIHALTGATPSIYSLGGMILVTGILSVPSMYLLISPQFARFDAALEDAASTVGVSWFHRTRLIVLPLLAPAIIAAGMLLVIVALEAFDVPAILGYPSKLYIFSTLIQQAVQPPNGAPNYGLASGYGIVLLVLAIALILVYRRAVRDSHRFRTITGKGFRPAVVQLGKWRTPALACVLAYLTLAVVLPFLILLWASLLPFYSVPSWAMLGQLSLANYKALLGMNGIVQAAGHTAVILLVSATVTMALASWAGWVSVRRRFAASWVPIEASFLVLGVPGVVMGLALLYLYLVLPIPIYGSVWIIVVAYVTRFMPFSGRLMDAAFRQLDAELEQAGQVTGASGFTIARTITAPLLLPAIVRGWIWVAAHSVSELPMALLLATATNKTLAVALWQMWTDNADYSRSSALAVILALVSGLSIWVVSHYGGGNAETRAAFAA